MRERTTVVVLVVLLVLAVGAGFLLGIRQAAEESPRARPDATAVVGGTGGVPGLPGRPEASAPATGHRPPGSPPPGTPDPASPPLPPSRLGPPGVLAGRVLAAGSREPLEGVRLVISRLGGKPLAVATDRNGEFLFEDVPAGEWSLRVRKEDFVVRALSGITLTEDSGIEEMTILLGTGEATGDQEAGGYIEGQVTASGAPVRGAWVSVSSFDGARPLPVRTDGFGRYRVGPLLPGTWMVRVSQTGPSGGRVRSVEVPPGGTVRADFGGAGALHGLVLDSKGRAMAGVLVRVSPATQKGGYESLQATTDEEGRFTVEGTGQGLHHVAVQSLEKGNQFEVRTEDVELTGDDQEIQIRLLASEVSGRVVLAETGEPAPSNRPYLRLYRPAKDEAGKDRMDSVGYAPAEADGTFCFRGVPPGRYLLVVAKKDYHQIRREIELANGESKTGLDLRLERLRSGTLRIRVRDEKGVPVTGLYLRYYLDEKTSRSLINRSPEPGLYVSDQLEAGGWKIALQRRDLRTARIDVEIREGQTTETSLVMRHLEDR